MNEFSRTELLLGAKNMEKLKNSTVMILGVGGVGSHCIEALARTGVGCLILVDNDTISLTNINRQSIAYHSTIGQYKTKVMAKRIADINPEARVQTFEAFILPENIDQIFSKLIRKPDYIIDAIDTVTAKLALALYARDHQIPLIASMGTGNKVHPELFKITDISKTSVCPLCKVMRRELKRREIYHLKVLYSAEEPIKLKAASEEVSSKRAIPGSVAFVPPVAGLLIAGEVIRELGDDID